MNVKLQFQKKVGKMKSKDWIDIDVTSNLPNEVFKITSGLKEQLEKEGWVLR